MLVDQVLIGYGLLAVEGMASGLPVLSRTGWIPDEVARHPSMRELPIVDVDSATLRDRLRRARNRSGAPRAARGGGAAVRGAVALRGRDGADLGGDHGRGVDRASGPPATEPLSPSVTTSPERPPPAVQARRGTSGPGAEPGADGGSRLAATGPCRDAARGRADAGRSSTWACAQRVDASPARSLTHAHEPRGTPRQLAQDPTRHSSTFSPAVIRALSLAPWRR